MATEQLARRWLVDLLMGGGPVPADRWVSTDCIIHMGGASVHWWSVRCLAEAYRATFNIEAVDVAQVATWRDKAMVAYTVTYTGPEIIDRRRGTAFMTVIDATITEAWLLDDWDGWLARQSAA